MSTLLTPAKPVSAASSLETAGLPVAPATASGLLGWILRTEESVLRLLRVVSVPALRIALGVVFVWFGVLKVIGSTPVADFVARTLPWFDRHWLVPALGIFEVVIGLAMLVGRFLTVVCAVMVAHLIGTFLSLVMQPDVTFQHGNPFMLTEEGEFVMKNLVLIAAGLVIAARYTRPSRAAVPSSRRPVDE
jgi:uncharacterized membrane protein YkgB